MDRAKIKEKAKKMIVGKKWYLWKPMVVFDLITFLVAFAVLLPVGICTEFEGDGFSLATSCVSSVMSFFETIFMFGYAKYCIDFVRGKEEDWKEPFKFGFKNIGPAIAISFLVGLNVLVGFILLIVPGIMAAIGLTFVQEVYADNTKLSITEVLKKSWEITNGHKMDLFVLTLSFFGWFLLAGLTLGILFIWLFPYFTITFILAYEELKK